MFKINDNVFYSFKGTVILGTVTDIAGSTITVVFKESFYPLEDDKVFAKSSHLVFELNGTIWSILALSDKSKPYKNTQVLFPIQYLNEKYLPVLGEYNEIEITR